MTKTRLASLLLAAGFLLTGCAQIESRYAAFFGEEPAVEEAAPAVEEAAPAALEKTAVRAPIVIETRRPVLSQRFKVFQTLDKGALANLCRPGDTDRCHGMIVYLEGNVDPMLYDEKSVFVTNPVVTSTWKYVDRDGLKRTVPVVSDRRFHEGETFEPLQ